MIEDSNGGSVFKLEQTGNYQMEGNKSRRNEGQSSSSESKASRQTAQSDALGKRSIAGNSQAQPNQALQEDVPVSRAFPLMESVVDPMLLRVRKMRETTTDRMEKDLTALNSITSTFKGPMGMKEEDEKKIRKLPVKALGMSRCLQDMNRFTSGMEKVQQQHVTALNRTLSRTDKKKVEADAQIESIKRREENIKKDAFIKRFHFGLELESAINLHNNHIQVLGACLKLVPTLCIKCWGIFFIGHNNTIYLDKASNARIALPSAEVFQPHGPNNKSIRAVIESWARCSKTFLKPDPDLTKPCIQDYFPFIVLPGEEIGHACWNLDLVIKEDVNTVLRDRARVLNAEHSLDLLKGLDGPNQSVNNPQMSTGDNPRRVFKQGLGGVVPLNLGQARPSQASNHGANPNELPQGQQPANPPAGQNGNQQAASLDSVEPGQPPALNGPGPQASPAQVQQVRRRRLAKRAQPVHSQSRTYTVADTTKSIKAIPGAPGEQRCIPLDRVSALASELPEPPTTMDLLTLGKNWNYVTFVENGVKTVKPLSAYSQIFLSDTK